MVTYHLPSPELAPAGRARVIQRFEPPGQHAVTLYERAGNRFAVQYGQQVDDRLPLVAGLLLRDVSGLVAGYRPQRRVLHLDGHGHFFDLGHGFSPRRSNPARTPGSGAGRSAGG